VTITLDVVPAGSGEIVVDGLSSNSYPYQQAVVRGNDVTLEAVPTSGYSFVKWTGELVDDENNDLLELTKVIRNMNITAKFVPDAMKFASEDEVLSIMVPEETTALDGDGEPLTFIQLDVADIPTPEQTGIIGLPYQLEPSGATFDPPITITWRYDPTELPPGVAEEDLVITYLSDGGEWIEIPSDVDYEKDMLTAEISHLTIFALRAPTFSPSEDTTFTTSSLNVSPAEVSAGESIEVSALLTNTTAAENSYPLTLLVDGVVADTKSMTVAGNTSETVTFTVITGETGIHSVDLNGLFGSFTVNEGTSPPAPPSTPGEPSPTPPSTLGEPSPTSPETPAAPATPAGTGHNWVVLGPIIAGVFLAVFIPLRMRYRNYHDW
jgi:hypothetical protein